jgi:hypothetical protein
MSLLDVLKRITLTTTRRTMEINRKVMANSAFQTISRS